MLVGMVRTDTAWISQQMGGGLEIHTLYQSRRCDLYFPYYSSSFSVYIIAYYYIRLYIGVC